MTRRQLHADLQSLSTTRIIVTYENAYERPRRGAAEVTDSDRSTTGFDDSQHHGADTAPAFDPFDPVFDADPWPVWKRLRETDPVWHWAETDSLIITGYAEVVAALRAEEDLVLDRSLWIPDDPVYEPSAVEVLRSPSLPAPNAQNHTRVRRLVAKAFTPRTAERIRSDTESLCRELAEKFPETTGSDGAADVVSGYAAGIPVTTISWLLGIPPGNEATFKHHADTLIKCADPFLQEPRGGRCHGRRFRKCQTGESDDAEHRLQLRERKGRRP